MFKKIIVFTCMIHFSCVLVADSMKFHNQESRDIPVTTAVKDVLEQIGSDTYQEILHVIKQQRPFLKQSVLDVQLLQALANQLSKQSVMSHQDVEKIKQVVDSLKEDTLYTVQQETLYDRASLQRTLYALSHEALAVLDSLSARHIDDDLLDLKQMFVQAQELTAQAKSDKKLTVRMLSVINEIFQKYDELFVSTYDIIMLSHVALIIFFMGSI